MGVPQNRWFTMGNPIKKDDLGGTPIFGNLHLTSSNHQRRGKNVISPSDMWEHIE